MRLFAFLFLSVTLFFISSCDTQKTETRSNTASTPQTRTTENNIVYLFFEIEKKSNGNEQVKHTETKITEGILKNASIDNKEKIPGNIIVTMLGNDGKTVEERIIEDPLNPMMESYSEEGLNREKMNYPKAEFSVRFNQKGEVSSVKLEKISEKSITHLITIKL